MAFPNPKDIEEALRAADAAVKAAQASGDTARAAEAQQDAERLAQAWEDAQGSTAGKLKAAGAGLAEGAIGSTLGLPGDVVQLAKAGGKAIAAKFGLDDAELSQKVPAWYRELAERMAPTRELPTTADLSKAFGIDYQPKTEGEKWIKSISGGVGGMLGAPVKGLSTLGRVALGSASGAGAEAGEQLLEGPGRIGGAVTPMMMAMFLQGRTPNIVRTAKPYLEDLGPEGLQQAGAAAARGTQELGRPIALHQGVEGPTAVKGLAEALMQSKEGGALRRVVGEQMPAGQERIGAFNEALSRQPPASTSTQRIIRSAAENAMVEAQVRNVDTNDLTKAIFNAKSLNSIIDQMNKGGPEDVAKVAKELTRQDKRAFPALVKAEFSRAAETSRKGAEGRTPQESIGEFVNAVYGDSASLTRARFIEKMTGVARAQDKFPAEVIQAASSMMEALNMISRDRGALGRINPGELREMAGRNPVSTMLQTVSPGYAPGGTGGFAFFRPWRIGTALKEKQASAVLTELSELLSTPEGTRKLVEIASYDPGRKKMQAFLLDLLGAKGAVGVGGEGGENRP